MAEVTRLVLLQRLFAAGVGGENLVVGVFLDVEGVLLVRAFEVDDAGFAVLPRALDNLVPEFLRGDRKHLADLDVLAETEHVVDFLRLGRGDVRLFGAGVREDELLVVVQRLHEAVGDADGDVEVREVALDGVAEVLGDAAVLVDEFARLVERVDELVVREVVGVVQAQRVGERHVLVLRVEELDDVGVGDAHDAHLCAAARAALRDGLAHLVERPHERDGAGGDAAGRADRVAVGAELPEGVAHAAAGLEHLGGLLGRLVDVRDVVGG